MGSLPITGIGFLARPFRYGMLYPRLAVMPSLKVSTMWVRNSFAACWFLENFHTIHTLAAHVFTRLPFGPAGSMPMKVFLNTSGFVSSVVRYAEIASWTQHAMPEAR